VKEKAFTRALRLSTENKIIAFQPLRNRR
jgi:hypothetical protein